MFKEKPYLNSPKHQAIKDIREYLRKEFEYYNHGNQDTYIVNAQMLDTKEIRRMNRELGLWGVNKTAENMTRKKIVP